MSYLKITKELKKHADKKRAQNYMRFFKTGKGEYGEGDRFLGITVPDQRQIAKTYRETNFNTIHTLLISQYHEHRLTALLILVYKYQKADTELRKQIYTFYLKHTKQINSWDLVDVTSPHIVGNYLQNRQGERQILYQLARSQNLWERRIAILATFTFIRDNKHDDAFAIAEILLHDTHDLIHKAVGWMLREIGKRNKTQEIQFLDKYYQSMPRTMLRYAIEKFDSHLKKHYLTR